MVIILSTSRVRLAAVDYIKTFNTINKGEHGMELLSKRPFVHYKTRILYYQMAKLEEKLGKMFHEIYPDIEKQYWIAVEAKNTRKLASISQKLDKEIDKLEQEESV